MAYVPPGFGQQNAARLGLGPAVALGAIAALACAFVVGVLSGLANIQFSLGAVLIGLCTGWVIRRSRNDSPAALASAIVAVVCSAASSVIGFITHILHVSNVPLSYVLAHLSLVLSNLPHYLGFLGFLFWALGGYIGWVTVNGRARRSSLGMRRAAARNGQVYGAGQQPYGMPVQPMYGAPGQAQDGSAPGYGAPGYGTPGYGAPGYGAPGYGTPGDGTPGDGTPGDGAPGGPATGQPPQSP